MIIVFEKAEMPDKHHNNWESCLTKEKRSELGLLPLYCQEDKSGFMTVNKSDNKGGNSTMFDLLGAEFHCMAINIEKKRKRREKVELKRNCTN